MSSVSFRCHVSAVSHHPSRAICPLSAVSYARARPATAEKCGRLPMRAVKEGLEKARKLSAKERKFAEDIANRVSASANPDASPEVARHTLPSPDA
eukprot:912211-Rhodomonas_salina.2